LSIIFAQLFYDLVLKLTFYSDAQRWASECPDVKNYKTNDGL